MRSVRDCWVGRHGTGNVAIDPETVVGAWLFDEGEGEVLEDISGNGHDGIIVGKPKWVDCKFGKVLTFDG